MKLIETYKKVIEYQLHYTLMGTEQFAEVGNLDRIRLFIFPELDKLEIGKEIPENLKKLSNGYMANLSYTFATKFYPLYLKVNNGILEAVTTDFEDLKTDKSETEAVGYYTYMD